MLVEFGHASLIGKARSQPDKVKQVLDKIRTDGFLPTVETVFKRLDEPIPLGYCNAGVVLEVGAGVTEFRVGDRLVSNGPHAEIVCVPKNLCAKIPDGVMDDHAAFTVLASIGLQGIRLVAPTLGERVVVYGLGLIGLMTVQLLRAHGCEVLGVDISANRLTLAKSYGASICNGATGDPVAAVNAWTGGVGADAVLITASAKTSDIAHQSAVMCRKRGRVVLVGVVGLDLKRADFYEKEIMFQVSCSYGPGRYEETYEQEGHDYPLGYVRWTEQRNFEAVLTALRENWLDVDGLISHRFPFEQAPQAYEKVTDGSALGIVLQYPQEVDRSSHLVIRTREARKVHSVLPVLAVIGAGNFSKMTLMPALAKAPCAVRYVCDLNGASAAHLARKYDAEQAVSDHRLVLKDDTVDAVLIATGHNSHGRLVQEALHAGKHVFVEKPLAMSPHELTAVVEAAQAHPDLQIMVGFNRRFSPHVQKMFELLEGHAEPLALNMTVNAGIIPPNHWVHHPERGGGRIIGEACHFIDLMVHLTGSLVRAVSATMMGPGPAVRDDKMSIVLAFEDGSVGTVNYFGNGSKTYPKEVLEVFSDGRVLRLDNFRRLDGYGFKGFKRDQRLAQNKGHAPEIVAFAKRLSRGGQALIPLDQLVNVTLASFAAVTAAREERTVKLGVEYAALGHGTAAA